MVYLLETVPKHGVFEWNGVFVPKQWREVLIVNIGRSR